MSSTPETAGVGAPARARVTLYSLAWRWHAWAGLLVVPFLLTLALTGAVMVFFTGFQTRLGMNPTVEPLPTVQAVSAQAAAAMAAVPGGELRTYIAPREPDRAAWFVVQRGDDTLAVAVDPYRATPLRTVDKERTPYAWAERIHATLLIGDVGDRLIEIAAWASLVMLVTGGVLWWPRGPVRWSTRFKVDGRARGRGWWRALHGALGAWTAVFLVGFLVTGLTWTGITGARWLQVWDSFPAAKWYEVPASAQPHSSLNTAGLQEVPWGLAQAPMPASASPTAGAASMDLDRVAAMARDMGFAGQHQIALPKDATGVFTVSSDSMSGDSQRPTGDRTVHLDRYSGRVLADIRYEDYGPLAKTMAVATALHQGDLGWWNALLNLMVCLAVALLCVAGVAMWWKRRPAR
ncbi:PepSY-associated TM helix domain-containing protein [Hydrogenophaga sp. XSHU_21]